MSQGRVLVTGAFGFLGLPLLRKLTEAGYEVVGFGHPPRNEEADEAVPASVRRVYGDVCKFDTFTGRKPNHGGIGFVEAVIHLAGGGGPKAADRDPLRAAMTALSGTAQVAAFAGTEVPMILASSSYVYAPRASAEPITAALGRVGPTNLYGGLKVAAEALWMAAALPRPHAVVLRFCNLYGHGPVVGGSVVDIFARRAASGRSVLVVGHGAKLMEYLHTEDAAELLSAAVRRGLEGGPIHGTFNAGSGESLSVLDLAKFAQAKGAKAIEFVPGHGPEAEEGNRIMDSAETRWLFGWEPQVGLAQGLDAYFDHVAASPRPQAPVDHGL